jgi:hypothetical protein
MYVTAYPAVSPSPPISSTMPGANAITPAAIAAPKPSDSQSAWAPRRLAMRTSPAPAARPTWAVVPYWRKLKMPNSPLSTTAAIPSAAS